MNETVAVQDRERLAAELPRLIAEILEIDPARITPATHFMRDLQMDSLMSLELLAMLEKRYGIRIPEEALPQLATLEGVIGVVGALSP
jgi:acyl carrier protein